MRQHITPEQARRVAAAFEAAPRHAPTATTVVAYAQLEAQSSHWYACLTGGLAGRPIRVVITHCREPYATASELADSVRRLGVLELWPTARDHDRRHPLLDSAVGGSYDRLRAVHDIVSHGWLGHEFDADGEFSAWLAERRLYTGLARWALATELHGEHSVQWTTESPADHKAVLLDPSLLRASRDGGSAAEVARGVEAGVGVAMAPLGGPAPLRRDAAGHPAAHLGDGVQPVGLGAPAHHQQVAAAR